MPTIEQLQSLLEKEPNDAFLNFGLAMAFKSAGDQEQALNQFDHTIQVDENYVAAYFMKGQLLNQLDRMDEARATLQSGIAVATKIGDEHAKGEMTEYLEALPE